MAPCHTAPDRTSGVELTAVLPARHDSVDAVTADSPLVFVHLDGDTSGRTIDQIVGHAARRGYRLVREDVANGTIMLVLRDDRK